MRAGPRLSSQARRIDTFVFFIQHGASHHRITSPFSPTRSETETVRTFFDVTCQSIPRRRIQIGWTHVPHSGCCNWHVITVYMLSPYLSVLSFKDITQSGRSSGWNTIKWSKYRTYREWYRSFISFYQSKRFLCSFVIFVLLSAVSAVTYQVLFSFL